MSRRTREIGIRIALGARRRQILAAVFQRTLLLCAVGVSLGVTITLFAGKLLSAVLWGVSPRDPAAYASAIAVMTAVALLACWQPASRAIRTNPALSLRQD